MLTNTSQDKNKLIIGENQLRFNREYIMKCKATSANIVGEASHRIKTVEKASDITFSVEPNTGIAETTSFTLSVQKKANEELNCRFFQELNGEDVRIDDENQEVVYSKAAESIETTLTKVEAVKGSTFVKVMAFCTNKDMKA